MLAAVPLAVPVTYAVTAAYPTIRANLSLVLAAVVVALIASERTWRGRAGGALSFALAAALGALTLDLSPDAPLEAGGMLAPLFAGLFGAPVLIDAIVGGGIPRQDEERIALPRWLVASTAVAGTLAGAVVGYIPASRPPSPPLQCWYSFPAARAIVVISSQRAASTPRTRSSRCSRWSPSASRGRA